MANTNSFPQITIILIDDDPICLSIISKVLQKMNHHVVAFKSPLDALFTLRMRKRSFDLILTDVHMPEMSGLELLKQVEEEFKLPVVLMSADKNIDMMKQGLEDGAAFYLVKPISANYLSRIWQYAIPMESTNKRDGDTTSNTTKLQVNNNNNNIAPVQSDQIKANTQLFYTNKPLKRSNSGDLGMRDGSSNKKPKLVWTTSLHNLFLEAVNKFGIEKAVPKKILEYMNVPGLKRENVSSHLQKYRIFLKRIQEATNSMQDGNPNNWNERPFRSSFVLNEITFLTNNLHQQYLELLAHAQGNLNGANVSEKGQSSSQAMNLPEAISPTKENSFHNKNAPIYGLDDKNVYIPRLDHNGTQQENSFGIISQDLSGMYGIADELKQLGVDIQIDQDAYANDFKLGSYDVQGDKGSLNERLDQGISANDDTSFECYFAQDEFNQHQVKIWQTIIEAPMLSYWELAHKFNLKSIQLEIK